MITFCLMLLSAASVQAQQHVLAKELPFQPGEVIGLKASVGFIKAAEAECITSEVIYNINNKPTYKMDINAWTTGVFDLFSSVRDNWGSYYDTTEFVPQQFYRYIKEGRFRKNEILYFDHTNEEDSVTVTVAKLDKETRELRSQKMHKATRGVQDMVSGYYYLRSIDFNQLNEGDVISIDTFFDDKLEPFKVKFVGREVIKTKLGKIRAIVLVPLMEKDSIFVEDNTIKVWLSDDLNKIPLKVKAKIFVGSLNVEVQNVKNLRHRLALTQ